jgi:hypothetical protein
MNVLEFAPNDVGLLISNISNNLDLDDVINDLRGFARFSDEDFFKVSKVEITVVLNKDSPKVASYFSRPLSRG